MVAEENIVVEILRRIQAELADMRTDIREQRSRLGHLERGQGQIDQKLADIELRFADLGARLDRRDDVFERILRRLDLVDAPH